MWAEIGEGQMIGPKLMQETTKKISQIKDRLKVARDHQKSYVDKRKKPLEFSVGDYVLLKVLPWKVSLSDVSTNKALQVAEDPPCPQTPLNSEHERLALIHVLLGPKPRWIHPVDSELFNSIVQCLVDLLQRAITELVYLGEAHHHLNPIFIPKYDSRRRIDDGKVMLVLKSCDIPLRFGEVQLSLVALNPKLKVFYALSYN
nr:putative reverse transcriptase domain-containing protein [Tanacetum cinerariifolium]